MSDDQAWPDPADLELPPRDQTRASSEDAPSPQDSPLRRARALYEEHPFACIGAAAVVGYVAAGGLNTPMTWRLLKLGAQRLLLPTLQAQALKALGMTADEG